MSRKARELLTEEDMKEARRLCGESRGDRVDFIYMLMSNVQWKRGQTGRILAEVWHVSANTVDQYASEAYRRFRSNIGDTDDLRGMIVAKLEHVVDDAMQNTKVMLTKDGSEVEVAAPDHRAAIQGLMGIGELCGLKVRKQEVKVKYEEYSKESLNSLMEKAKGVLASGSITTEGEQIHGALPDGVSSATSDHASQFNHAEVRVRSGDSGRD